MEELKCLLVTANIGSIFEDKDITLQQWLNEFLKTIDRLQPSFVAVHCQEVGGKNYEDSMQHVDYFVKCLLSSSELCEYDRVRLFLDEDFTVPEKFTALGNLYFVHQRVGDVNIWDFREGKFVPVCGKDVFSGNIEDVPIMEKIKFPLSYFPESRPSRKGFLRTRWQIYDKNFDLINIHLFHDASNLTAMEQCPSSYSTFRRNALEYMLNWLENSDEVFPFFLFGDFNFRLDSHNLIKKLSGISNGSVQKMSCKKSGKLARLQYMSHDETFLTVESKLFEHNEHEDLFIKRKDQLREYDKELQYFSDRISEFSINFPPSYPFSEDVDSASLYMRTRCPSWCDRVLMSREARSLINETSRTSPQYSVIGSDVCVGDHKPVYLNFNMLVGGKQFQENTLNNNDPNLIQSECSPTDLIPTNGEVTEGPLHYGRSLSNPVSCRFPGGAPSRITFGARAPVCASRLPPITSNTVLPTSPLSTNFRNVVGDVMKLGNSVTLWRRASFEGLRRRHHSSSSEEGVEGEEESCMAEKESEGAGEDGGLYRVVTELLHPDIHATSSST